MLVKTVESVDGVVDAVEGVLSFVVVLCVDTGAACGVLTSSVVDVNSYLLEDNKLQIAKEALTVLIITKENQS